MEICDSIKCTGCGACMNVCPQKCIEMNPDSYGELHPYIDNEKCIKCNRCVKVCPSNKTPILREPEKVYASWRSDVSKTIDSASGGIGAALAENWIKQGGVVFGTEFDEQFNAVVCKEDTLEGIEAFKGSKYVQSNTGFSYSEVKKLLSEGKKVLFFGTPCQLAGLYAVLNCQHPNLYTVEILCHGVSSNDYLHEELKYIKTKYRIKKFGKVTFRTNRWWMNYYFCLWNKDKVVFSQPSHVNEYFRGYITGLTLRESCYNCNYKHTARLGDLLIGDFIGFGENPKYPWGGEKHSTSLILVISEKGNIMLSSLNDEIVLIERTIDEALIKGTSLKMPFPRHEKQSDFRKIYRDKGFVCAVHETIGDEIRIWKKRNRKTRLERKVKLMINNIFKIKK